MNKIKKSVFFIVIVFAVSIASAQTKVAQININELYSSMPDYELADKELQNLKLSLGAKLEALKNEYRKKRDESLDLNPSRDDYLTNKKKIDKEVADLLVQIEEEDLNSKKIYQQKVDDLEKSIREKALVTIQKVGRQKGFTFVIDSSFEQTILLNDGILPDLLEDVKNEMGIRD